MKKIINIVFIFLFISSTANAVSIGSYKTESEYGLIDGFKFNSQKNKNAKDVSLKNKIQVRDESENDDSKSKRRYYEEPSSEDMLIKNLFQNQSIF